jgi:hypothetical protein
MATIISASIDLTKIDKSRIVPGKNGAQYYNIQINVNDEADQYGNNAFVVTNQTKEERDAKAQKTYLGNGKTVWSSSTPAAAPAPVSPKVSVPVIASDDLPF